MSPIVVYLESTARWAKNLARLAVAEDPRYRQALGIADRRARMALAEWRNR